jgi:DNA-binding beta-propeller fold protein YncE
MRSCPRRSRAPLAVAAILLAIIVSGCGGSGGGQNFSTAIWLRSIPLDPSQARPLDVIIDSNNSVYVVDAGWWKISKYTIFGAWIEDLIGLTNVTAADFGPGENIFAVTPDEIRVRAFNLAGVIQPQLEFPLPAGTLAYGVAVNGSGIVYVWALDTLPNPDTWSILKCTGGVCQTFMPGGITLPIPVGQQQRGVAVDIAGNVYYVDPGAGVVRVVDPLTMQTRSIGSPGQLSSPCDVAVDTNRNVYVADTGHHRILKFDSSGQVLFGFGVFGALAGQLNTPQGVAVDGSGNIVVADTGNDRIQVFRQM